ncbi:unnamed protein product [Effrenium voratum]|nr:unnamed protein product [Effrenium voratum]
MTWRWEIWLLATVNGLDTETACNLQVRHQEALLTDSNAKLWSIPRQRFHECPKKPRRSVQNLQMEASSAILKPQCHPGETLIGRFIGDAYKFSCCSAGEQCAGCTEIQDGVCRQCSSGYVKQSIPILNKSKCFICDDLPRWTDAQGRTCDDYASLCNGSWPSPEVDQAFQGVRPSDACCACGGGNVFPTPVYMPLAGSVLHHSQVVNETPVPLTAEAIEVEEGCGLAAAGLRIASSGPGLGGVSGVVGKDAQPVHCSATVVQDPMRGLYFTVDLDLAVSAFSYGRAVVSFKSWGLQPVAAEEAQKPVEKAKALGLQEFSLDCNPTCPWLEIDAAGTLQYLPTGEGNLGAGVQDFPGMPACSCEVSALNASNTSKSLTTSFVALQARLWQGGAYEASAVEARVGEAMVPLQLQELLSPGLRFYTRAGHTTNLQVVENLTSHQRFAVPNAVPPAVLDVNCTGASLQLSWSRSTGDVELGGRLAFNLDPKTGALSGTPSADLLQATQGQASLQVACQVALGGDFYDRELPVATVAVKLLDDTCWVPSQPLAAVWKNAAASSQAACVRLCRVLANCAAASWANSICWLAVSDGTEPRVVPEALIRVNDCSKQKADLDLKVPGALFAAGKFSATNNYKDQVTFSRPGPTPERQLLLAHASVVQSELPAVCQNASWLLVHTNSSDYEDASTAAPEFFGGVLACASGDIVDLAFALGTVKMFWNFTEAHAGSHLQDATLSIAVPSCSKPDLAPGMVAGTPEEAALYSLQECECFGEAYATTAPVDADSNAAVSRSGAFNIGPLADQLIFSGPYTCESEAKITSLRNADSTVCQGECHRNSACHFYISEKATSLCTLFSRCDFLQLVDLPAANELWAKPPPDNFCRIADPESCWESVQRRSLLSFTPSDLPTCLFQTQYDACDALQILSGGSAGKCYRCQYFNVSSSFAQQSLKKVPFPEESPAGAQIQVGCNYTSRLFAEDGLSWEPGKSSTFTCVSGEWVGEDGAWQSLANLSCRACLQLGTPRLQRLSALQMPSIYFLEHRLAQFAKIAGEGQDGWGACPHAGFLTASPLLSGAMCLDVSGPSSVKLGSSCNASWWLDGHLRLRVKSEELDDTTGPWCLCSEGSEASHLAICECGVAEELGRWTLNNGRLEQLRGSRCVLNNQGKLTTKACPLKDDNRFQWHFNGGDCIFGMNLVDSAELTWNVSLPSQSGVESLLTEIRYLPVVAYAGVQYYFVQNSAYCLEASGNQVKVSYASPCSTSWLYEKQHVSISGTSAYLRAMPNGTVVLQEFAFGASGFSWEWSQGSLKNQDGKCLAAFRDATVETYVNYSSSVTAADDDTDLYDDGRNFRYSFGCNRENNFISQLWLPEKALMQQGGNEQHAASTQCEYLQGYNQWWKSCKEYVLFQDFDGGKYVRHALVDIEALDCDAGYALSGLSMQYEHDVTPPFQVSWTCCPLPSEMPAMNVPVSSKTQWYGTVSCPPNSVLSVFTFNDYFEFAGECTSFETIVSPNNPYFPVGAWTFPQAGNGQKGNSFQFASFAFWAHAVIQALWVLVCCLLSQFLS